MRPQAFRFVVLAIVVCVFWGGVAFAADPASVLVTGPKGERKLTAADLASLPRVEVVVSDHGKPAKFRGVSLYSLLEPAGAPAGEARGAELTKYVVVEASDGYRAVFSLAEPTHPRTRARAPCGNAARPAHTCARPVWQRHTPCLHVRTPRVATPHALRTRAHTPCGNATRPAYACERP